MSYRTFKYHPEGKLVYDGWVADNKAMGAKPKYRILPEPERIAKLRVKLAEETKELSLASTEEERAKERGDINDIRFALGELSTQEHKPDKTFTLGIFAESVSLPADPNNTEATYWIEYYAAHPERFQEIDEV